MYIGQNLKAKFYKLNIISIFLCVLNEYVLAKIGGCIIDHMQRIFTI
jgi:hypothetical protein